MAHGAGAGMAHPFMTAMANGLAGRGIATLRYQFPYMEQGSKRPDTPKLAQATVRAAVAEASRLVPELPLFAGGKSFGGRMTSQAQAASPLARRPRPGVPRLPAPPCRAAVGRARERTSSTCKSRCCSCREPAISSRTCRSCRRSPGSSARAPHSKLFQDADHSFHVPARTGRKDAEIMAEMSQGLADWIEPAIRRAVRG